MEISNLEYIIINNIPYVSLDINGVHYDNVSPKFILNRKIFNEENVNINYDDIKYKSPEYINKGINCVDIDWNDTNINDNKISNTSDLIKKLSSINIKLSKLKQANNYWENFNNSSSQPSPMPILGYIADNGNIIVDNNSDTYTYRYETKSGEIIENFRPLMYDELNLINYNMAPYNASIIGVYNESNIKIGYIDVEKMQHPTGQRLYRVGLMSDVHYNDDSGSIDDSMFPHNDAIYNDDLINAFDFFNNKEGVEFTCISGDVTTNLVAQEEAFIDMRNIYSKNTPVYACRGNHDNAAFYNSNMNYSLWNEVACSKELYDTYYCGNISDGENINMPALNNLILNVKNSNTEDKSNFFFLRPIGNTFDVFIFFSVDYNGPGTGANYSLDINDNQYYSQHSIVWLLSVLDKYRNHRCFIFTHLFFPEKAGNNTSGNYYNYALGRGNYVLAGNNFEILNFANNYYKNAIWFTGHSHYKWMWAKIDNKINICKYDPIEQCESAWNVHLPSLSRPLGISGGYYVKGEDSEAAIMDVYENYVDIRGIEMKTDEVTKYFGVTDLVKKYIHDNDRYINASDFKDPYNVTQLSNDYVEVKFTDTYEYFVGGEGLNIHHSIQTPVLYIEDVIITDINGNDITDEALSTNNIGFRYISQSDEYSYKIESNIPITFYNDGELYSGILFKLSSSYTGDRNITVKFKGKLKFVNNVNYLNKYTPIGNYRLDTTIKQIKSLHSYITNQSDESSDSFDIGNLTTIYNFVMDKVNQPNIYSMPLINDDGSLNISIHNGNPIINTIIIDGETYLDVTFTETKQQCSVTNDYVKGLNVIGAKLNLSYVEYICASELTDLAKEYIGFYKDSDHKYTTENNAPLDVILLNGTNGCEFNCSSRYISEGGGVLPVTIRMKGYVDFMYN